MELRHLRYVLAVAEELHFTHAAERLCIGQPPLSQQIKQVEEEVGAKLFKRGTRSVELTDAGRAFLPHAKAALREAEQAIHAARQANRGELGTVRIGFTSSASFNRHVPRIVSHFRDAYPEVELYLMEQATNLLLNALQENAVDIVFIRPTLGQRENLVSLTLPPEALWIALPAGHPLSKWESLQLIDLAHEAFVLYPRENGSLLYDSIIAACRNAGFSPYVAQEAPQMASTVNLVAAGVGVAIVPESMCQIHPQGVTYVRIADPAPSAMLWVAHRHSQTVPPVVQNFMQEVYRYLADLEIDRAV